MNALVRNSLIVALALAPVASAQLNIEPEETKGIGIEQKLDAQVPLDLKFKDQDGRDVTLGDLVDGTLPVILTLNYSSCPMLCSVQLNEMVMTLEEVALEPGKDYRIVTVSVDPKELPQQAARAKDKYLNLFRKAGAREGWTFLVGIEKNIRALAEAVGFNYRLDPETGEYLHAAALILLTPDGKVGRYLAGIKHEPDVVRLSLVETSDGTIGSLADMAFLMCYRYNPDSGGYEFAMGFMRIFGGLVPILFLVFFWMRMRKYRTPRPAAPSIAPEPR